MKYMSRRMNRRVANGHGGVTIRSKILAGETIYAYVPVSNGNLKLNAKRRLDDSHTLIRHSGPNDSARFDGRWCAATLDVSILVM